MLSIAIWSIVLSIYVLIGLAVGGLTWIAEMDESAHPRWIDLSYVVLCGIAWPVLLVMLLLGMAKDRFTDTD